ncbi:MAG: cytochrome bd-I oxidase subunit CydX [Gallionellaceae bacterium]|nr:cytochrome bd-I oxidase subunit CydX [Gallionellaceae bacterium]
MWYFTWILGTSLALLLAIGNAMLCEARECRQASEEANAGGAGVKPRSGGRSQCGLNNPEED